MRRSRLREIYTRLLNDPSERRRIVEVLKALFRVFLEDWFRWEIFGWVLALFLGFTEKEVTEEPELGWFAKAAVASALLNSRRRTERLLGRALLYHTEIPPRELFVRHGGALLPAVVYHYRTSAQDADILKEAVEIAKRIEEELAKEGENDAGI